MPFLMVRNCEIYYEWITQAGSVRTDRPVLVFLHGWGGSGRYWRSTAQALTDRFDCLIYDLRGFGRSQPQKISPEIQLEISHKTVEKTVEKTSQDSVVLKTEEPLQPSPDYRLKSYGEDLDTLLSHCQVDRVSVLAHSMGCSIATYFLQHWGDRVDQCILTCGGVFKFNAIIFGIFYQVGQLVINIRPPWFYRLPGMDFLVMQRFLHRPIPVSDRQEFIEDYLSATPEAAIGTLLSVAQPTTCTEISDQIANLSIPTLVLSCDRDTIVPASLGKAAAQLNPRLKYQVLKKVGHFPMLEDPKHFLAAINAFLVPSH